MIRQRWQLRLRRAGIQGHLQDLGDIDILITDKKTQGVVETTSSSSSTVEQDDNTGDDNTGDDNTADDNTGDDKRIQEMKYGR